MDPVTAISIFVIPATILLEFIITHHKKKKTYEWRDTLVNLSLGTAAIIIGSFKKILDFSVLLFFTNVGLFEIGDGIGAWILLFVLVDFIFYWFHRAGHEIRFFWAAHATHHSSEKFNFSVALRAPLVHIMYRMYFYIPLAWLGFDPLQIIIVDSANMLYQFFLHNEHLGSFGICGWVFNTPSFHRAHHGSNEVYLDKNYGGMFIIWDRLFGTFQAETEMVRFGLTSPVRTYNPVSVAFRHWVQLLRDVLHAPLTEKINYLIRRPGWRGKAGKSAMTGGRALIDI